MSALLQTLTGDLDISSGNVRVSADVGTITSAKLTNLFAFFKGEWFADTREGIPYFQYVFVNNPNMSLIASIFERVARTPPGVQAVTDMALDYVSSARTLAVSITCQASDGSLIVGGIGVPFIVDVKPS